jgi:hypothetical protein
VVGVLQGGEARAYPLRWLDWHEVANDRLGGRSIAVVSCGFAGSAIAFDAQSEGGGTRTFGGSGLVLRSVRLMADHETRTLWNELTGRAVLGPEAAAGARLAPLPALVTTWEAWRARHPDTTALAVGAAERAPEAADPYGRYHASEETVFPVAVARRELAAKAKVYGLEAEGRTKAWPLDALLAERVRSDEVGGRRVVLVATRGRIELESSHPARARVPFSPGAEVRAYARGEEALAPGDGPDALRDADGGAWRVTDDALLAPDGVRYPRLPGTVAYWFAWQAFHPTTEIALGDAATFP